MENVDYKRRLIDIKVEEYLNTFGAVCIEGPKWCGKTWTSRQHAKSEFFVGNPAGNFQNRRLAELDVNSILVGDAPRLIDEWNEVPSIWDAVRYKCDEDSKKGKFILTGSSTPNHKGIMHSGAGRIGKLKMYPMSLYEAGFSTGEVSLLDICRGKADTKFTGEVPLINIIDYILRGGWPGSINIPLKQAMLIPGQYIDEIIDDDAYKVDGVKRDLNKMKLLLRSLARNESTTASIKKLKSDIEEIDMQTINIETVSDYLNVFDKLFLLNNQRPFSTNVRSRIRLKQTEKRHFVDPSIAASLLNLNEEKLINDLETLGFLFEALVERDLNIYASTFGGLLFHYQDYNQNEVDAVIELEDGSFALIEIKLGANEIEDAATNLLKVNAYFKEVGRDAKALIVICGLTNSISKREDGVIVVPITSLKN